MHYKLIISLAFLLLGANALAQKSTAYTYQGQKFRPGDQIVIQIRAGTIQPVESGNYNKIEVTEGKTGELISVDSDVATIKWDAQTWNEYRSKRQVELPTFVSTVHLGYIKVLSSKKLSKEQLAEYENYQKHSDEAAKKRLQEAKDLVAKYGDRYIYKAPKEDKEVAPTSSKKEKVSVVPVDKIEKKNIVPPDLEPEIIIPPAPEEMQAKKTVLSTNALIPIGVLVGISVIFLLIILSRKKL